MTVKLERIGRVGVVTIDRPAKRNAIDAATASELSDRLDKVESDGEIWCGVLTGTSEAFCAGTDLNEPTSPRTTTGGEYGIIRRKRTKPLIAAVEGVALGGGFEIALACDLIVAGEHSRFGLPEVGIGVIATCGGLFRGPRALPLNVAREMALSGAPFDPARLYQLGVVNEVVPDGEARAAAISFAERICLNSPISIRETLSAIEAYVSLDDDAAWHITDAAIAAIGASPDLSEGRVAFFERRKPRWRGLSHSDSRHGLHQ
jgi:enoyl-CoA hydratase